MATTYRGLKYDASDEEKKKLQQMSTVQAVDTDTEPQEAESKQAETKSTVQNTAASSVQAPQNNAVQISDESYNQALKELTAANKMPVYAGTYDDELNSIYNQIVNRDKFKYDINADMLYQQYKDQYVNLGQLAMKDTMGQAAALTGGYGSSYGQAVGQQQYDAYLQQLNNVVPELYGMALDSYNQEGDRLNELYALTGNLRDDEYGRYQDDLNRYWQERDYNYNNLLKLINSSGYNPTDDEIAAAGMTREQVNSYLKAWKAANPDLAYHTGSITPDEYFAYTGAYPAGYIPPSSGGYGGGGAWDYYDPALAAEQQRLKDLGLYTGTVDGLYGPLTQAAQEAEAGSNNNSISRGEVYREALSAYNNNEITREEFKNITSALH